MCIKRVRVESFKFTNSRGEKMKRITRYILPLMIVLSLLLTACGGGATPAATSAPATSAPATQAATEAATQAATEAATQAATEAATQAPAGATECPAGVEGMTLEMWS